MPRALLRLLQAPGKPERLERALDPPHGRVMLTNAMTSMHLSYVTDMVDGFAHEAVARLELGTAYRPRRTARECQGPYTGRLRFLHDGEVSPVATFVVVLD